MTGSNPIARSFMMMSFVTAALLLLLQWQQEASRVGFAEALPPEIVPSEGFSARSPHSPSAFPPGSPSAAQPVTPSPTPPSPTRPSPSSRSPHPPRPPHTDALADAALAPSGALSSNPPAHLGVAWPQLWHWQPPSSLLAWLGQTPEPAVIPLQSVGHLLQTIPLDIPHLVVDLSDRQVHFYKGAQLVASYDIAIGQAGWETPSGVFHVMDMQVDPHWQHPITKAAIAPGPGNPLGSRWIGFWTDGKSAIGFHGTYDTDLIGQAVSHGCVRMRNADIEALYTQVTLGTQVTVQP